MEANEYTKFLIRFALLGDPTRLSAPRRCVESSSRSWFTETELNSWRYSYLMENIDAILNPYAVAEPDGPPEDRTLRDSGIRSLDIPRKCFSPLTAKGAPDPLVAESASMIPPPEPPKPTSRLRDRSDSELPIIRRIFRIN